MEAVTKEARKGLEEYLRARGVDLVIIDNADCRQPMRNFISTSPALWNEDIGEKPLRCRKNGAP